MYEKKPWLKFYNNIPETIDYPRVTMYEALMRTVEQYPERIAYDYLDYSSTYGQFAREIDLCANALAGIGMKKGDTITIAMPTCPQGIICFYAANKLGIVASMIHPLSTAKEILYYLQVAHSRHVLTMEEHYDKLKEVGHTEPLAALILAKSSDYPPDVEKEEPAKGHADAGVYYWADIMATSYPEAPKADMDTDEMAVILYSGGTTGFPKGIMLSNFNVISEGMMVAAWGMQAIKDFSVLVILPIFHGFGLGNACNGTFMRGGKAILVPRFTPEIFAELIKSKRPSSITGVPTLYDALSRNPVFQSADLSCLKSARCGADTLPRTVKERFEEVVQRQGGDVTLLEGYGLTEAVTGIMSTPFDGYREGSVGIPYPDMLAKVVKIGTTEEAAVGEEGELCVSGPAVMLGYLGQPEETAETLRIHEDGRTWLHTGDIFTMDEDGYFYFKLRLKRMIKSSGMNVYPAQVEDVMRQHPDVLDACIIGVPDEAQVERVKAFIILKDRSRESVEVAEALINHCREHLIKWSCPREVEFRESFPLTRVGKTAYTVLEQEEIARLKAEGRYAGGK